MSYKSISQQRLIRECNSVLALRQLNFVALAQTIIAKDIWWQTSSKPFTGDKTQLSDWVWVLWNKICPFSFINVDIITAKMSSIVYKTHLHTRLTHTNIQFEIEWTLNGNLVELRLRIINSLFILRHRCIVHVLVDRY